MKVDSYFILSMHFLLM